MDVAAMLITILHLVGLPIVIIAALVVGLTPIAIVDGVVFLMMFAVEVMIWDVKFSLPRLRVQRIPEQQPQ